jgi:hypothetical protein
MSSLTNPKNTLYTTLLTGVNIRSSIHLQEDLAKPALGALIAISKQTSNPSTPPFEWDEFTAPNYARIINNLFFTSLQWTLNVALFATLVLPLVAYYDMSLNTSSRCKRTLQRHRIWAEIQRWSIGRLMLILPLTIPVPLILSLVGIAYWIIASKL